jgi:uncharacterized membrane protein
MSTIAKHGMFDRMKGAALLDIQTYEEVEADTTATGQAAIVVGIVSVAQAIGALGRGDSSIVVALLASLIGWLIWSGVTYLIGDKILGGTATWGELLRTVGFAQTPGIIAILGIVPVLGVLSRVVAAIWMLIAGIIAIRQALDFGTGKAVITALLGWLVIAIPQALLFAGSR